MRGRELSQRLEDAERRLAAIAEIALDPELRRRLEDAERRLTAIAEIAAGQVDAAGMAERFRAAGCSNDVITLGMAGSMTGTYLWFELEGRRGRDIHPPFLRRGHALKEPEEIDAERG